MRRASPPSSTATPRASRCRRSTGTIAGWQTAHQGKNRNAPKTVAQSNFQFQWVTGARTPDEAIEIARKFTLKEVAKNIRCPFPRHARRQRPRRAGGERAEALRRRRLEAQDHQDLRTDEGGAEHAHVDNRQVGIDFAADWLQDTLSRGQSSGA
jgi:hypothetical protein